MCCAFLLGNQEHKAYAEHAYAPVYKHEPPVVPLSQVVLQTIWPLPLFPVLKPD